MTATMPVYMSSEAFARTVIFNTTAAPGTDEIGFPAPISAILLMLTCAAAVMYDWYSGVQRCARVRLVNRGSLALRRGIVSQRQLQPQTNTKKRQLTIEESLQIGKKLLHMEQVRLRYLVNRDSRFYRSTGLFGGFDLSFFKGHSHRAIACLATTDRDGRLVRSSTIDVELPRLEYTSGLLGFREVDAFKAVWNKYRKEHPSRIPGVFLVDGNGLLHPRRFGSACHVGVALNIPTIGVAKKLLCIEGLTRDDVLEEVQHAPEQAFTNPDRLVRSVVLKSLVRESDTFGHVLGEAVLVRRNPWELRSKPVYVSVGHCVNLADAVHIVRDLSLYRVPEPVRQAGMLGRKRVRELEKAAAAGFS